MDHVRPIRFVIIASALSLIAGGRTPVAAAPPGEYQIVGRMSNRRSYPSAVVLTDGKVLVTGGEDLTGRGLVTNASADLFDPTTGTFTATGAMSVGRIGHTSVRLKDGRVLVVGGFGDGEARNMRRFGEVYDPATGMFSRVGNLVVPRVFPSATLLQDGRVLIVGGFEKSDAALEDDLADVAELFDPATGQFQATGAMARGRGPHAAVLLADGRAAVFGGIDERVEIYDPATGRFAEAGALASGVDFWGCQAILRPDGKVIVTGGVQLAVELYDPTAAQSTKIGELAMTHWGGTVIPLANGQLLLAGGTADKVHSKSELIDPVTRTVTPATSLPGGRTDYAAVALLDGRGLIMGGSNGSSIFNTAVVYVP